MLDEGKLKVIAEVDEAGVLIVASMLQLSLDILWFGVAVKVIVGKSLMVFI